MPLKFHIFQLLHVHQTPTSVHIPDYELTATNNMTKSTDIHKLHIIGECQSEHIFLPHCTHMSHYISTVVCM